MIRESSEKSGDRPEEGATPKRGIARRLDRKFWILTLLTSIVVGGLIGLIVDWLLSSSNDLQLESPATVKEYPEYLALLRSLEAQLLPARKANVHAKVGGVGRHEINPLLFSEFIVSSEHQRGEVLTRIERTRIRVRSDRLIGAVAFILTLLLMWVALLVYSLKRSREPEERSRIRLEMDLEGLLVDEIERLEKYCERVDSRSMFLLGFGIVAAIGGLGVIYYLVPLDFLVQGTGSSQEASRDISWLVKSFAIVAYVEGIALFLLRFHRHGTADYKYYSARRLREVRLLATLKLFSRSSLGYEKETLLASALLDEDPIGALPTGAKGGSEDAFPQLEKIVPALERLGRKGASIDGPRSTP